MNRDAIHTAAASALHAAEMFRHTPADILASSLSIHAFAPGSDIVREEEVGDALFILLSGTCDILCESGNGTRSWVARLGTGAVFGEQAMVSNRPLTRSASVRASSEVLCARLDRCEVLRFLDTDTAHRITSLGRAQAIARVRAVSPVLSGLAPGGADEGRLSLVVLPQGEALFHEGDPSTGAFFVASGAIEIRRDAGAKAVATVGAGILIGEVGVLEGTGRTATAIATTDTTLLGLPWTVFRRLHGNCAALRAMVAALWRSYALAGGRPVILSAGRLAGTPHLSATFQLPTGDARITSALEREAFAFRLGDRQVGREIQWHSPISRRTLRLDESGRLIAIDAEGEWPEAGSACAALIDGTVLPSAALTGFASHGLIR